jgi:hypothetical protein
MIQVTGFRTAGRSGECPPGAVIGTGTRSPSSPDFYPPDVLSYIDLVFLHDFLYGEMALDAEIATRFSARPTASRWIASFNESCELRGFDGCGRGTRRVSSSRLSRRRPRRHDAGCPRPTLARHQRRLRRRDCGSARAQTALRRAHARWRRYGPGAPCRLLTPACHEGSVTWQSESASEREQQSFCVLDGIVLSHHASGHIPCKLEKQLTIRQYAQKPDPG